MAGTATGYADPSVSDLTAEDELSPTPDVIFGATPPTASASAPSAASATSSPLVNSSGPTLQSVRAKVVNVAADVGPRVISGIWSYFTKFAEPLNSKGKNTQCVVETEPGKTCGALYKHTPQNGTRVLLDHLDKKHPEQYKLAMAANNRSKDAVKRKGAAFATAAAGAAGASIFPTGKSKTAVLTPQLKARLDRLSVIWCARAGRPWEALSDVGYKLLLSEFVPEYAASTMTHSTRDKILTSLYTEARASVIAELKSARDDLKKLGYQDPFCSLQLDMTSIGNDEFCTASVSVIPSGQQTTPVHLNLAKKVFRGQHTKVTIKVWIEVLTLEIFDSFITGAQPKDVYVAATVDQGRSIINACKALGIPTLQCLCHRVNSAVMWATGINGTPTTCKNKEGRELVSKAAALVGMFSHWCTNSDAFRALQEKIIAKQREEAKERGEDKGREEDKQPEMEDFRMLASDIEDSSEAAPTALQPDGLPRALAFLRRIGTRWASLFAFLERQGILEEFVMEFLKTRADMTHRGLSPEQWKWTKEFCCVLEPLKIVVTKIQGGVEGLLSRAIYLCHGVGVMLGEDEIETIDWASRRCLGDKAAPGPMMDTLDLSDVAQTVLREIASEFKSRSIGVPDSDVEFLALFLDPRTKRFGPNICGGSNCTQKARKALDVVKTKLVDTAEQVGSSAPPSSADLPPPKRQRVAANAYERRQQRKEEEAAAAVQEPSASNKPSIQDRLDKEVEEYELLAPVMQSKDFDVLGYWHEAGSPRVDPHGNVIAAAQFPILATLARVYLFVDSTSCQSEREFSGLGFVHSNLRRSTTPDRVEKLMFLRTNPGLIPEIKHLELLLAQISKAQLEGKAQAVETQTRGAGEEVVVEIEGLAGCVWARSS